MSDTSLYKDKVIELTGNLRNGGISDKRVWLQSAKYRGTAS